MCKGTIMQRSFRILLRSVKVLAISLVGFAGVLEVLAEFGLLSDFFTSWIKSALHQHGVTVEVKHVRGGFLTGLTAKDVRVYQDTSCSRKLAKVDQIRTPPPYYALRPGNPPGRSLTLRGGTLSVFPPHVAGERVRRTQTLTIRQLEGELRISENTLAIPELRGKLQGASLSSEGKVRDISWEHLKSRDTAEAKKNRGLSWKSVWRHLKPKLRQRAAYILKTLASQKYPSRTAELKCHFNVSCNSPEDAYADAFISLPDTRLANVSLEKLKAQLIFKNQRLHWRNANIRADDENNIHAQGTLTPFTPTPELRTTAEGCVTPAFLNNLPFPSGITKYAEKLNGPGKLNFSASLTSAPISLDSIRMNASIQVRNLTYKRLHIPKARTRLAYRDHTITLKDLKTRLVAGQKRVNVRGDLKYSVLDRTLLTGEISAEGDCIPFIKKLPHFPRTIGEVITPSDHASTTVRTQFDRTQISGKRLFPQGRMRLTVQNARIRRFPVDQAKATLIFKGEKLHVKNLAFRPHQNPVRDSLRGDAVINRKNNTIEGTCRGDIKLKHILQLLPHHLPRESVLRRAAENRVNISCSFTSSLTSPPNPQVKAQLQTKEFTVEGDTFRDVATRAQINKDRVQIAVTKAQTSKGNTLTANLRVDRDSGTISGQGRFPTPPQELAVFLPPGKVRKHYKRIWKHFEWAEDSPPIFQLRKGQIKNAFSKETKLRFDLEVSAEEFRYRGIPLKDGSGDVTGRLPGEISFQNFHAEHEDKPVNGDFIFYTKKMPGVKVHCKGTMDPLTVSSAFTDTEKQKRNRYQFADATKLEVHGFIPFPENASPRLYGRMQTPQFTAFDFPFKTVNASWHLRDNLLNIRYFTGKLAEGKVNFTGDYDLMTHTSELDVKFNGVQLKSVVRPHETWNTLKTKGQLSGNTEVTLNLSGSGKEQPELLGEGHLRLTKGNLWQMPLMAQLGKLLRTSLVRKLTGLGKITELEADFFFEGDHVRVPEFKTDGNIVALRGHGIYEWRTSRPDFLIRGILLEKTGIIPWLTQALSWAFEVRLHGTLQDPEYDISAIQGKPSGDQDAEQTSD